MNSATQLYEAQMLQQLIKNAERIAVVEEKITLLDTRKKAYSRKIDYRQFY